MDVAGLSGSDTPKVEPIAAKPVESTAGGGPSTVAGASAQPAGATSSPSVAFDGPAVSPPMPSTHGLEPVTVVKPSTDAARSPFDDPSSTDTDPVETPFGATASRTAAIAQQSPGATLPPANPSKVEAAPAGVQPPGGAAPSTIASPPPSPPIAANAEPPLPSREEMERQIQEEAAQKGAAIARQNEEKQAEDLRTQYEERAQFHQELRAVLAQDGNQAGIAIDQLCQKFGYKVNAESFALARRNWIPSESLANRARAIRRLDLPETVILNLLSDDFHAHLRQPGGPRNSNEVRVRAARLFLLRCGLPSREEATRQQAKPGPSVPPTNRRPATPAPKAAADPR